MKTKALSMKQPWAECIFSRGKNVENRTWNTKFRGWAAIHASNGKNRNEFELCKIVHGSEIDPDQVAYGSVIGFAKVEDVIQKEGVTEATKKWFQGDYGFVLTEMIRLKEPVKVKGSLGFWDLEGPALDECLDQIDLSERKRILESESTTIASVPTSETTAIVLQ